jgi:hypothetical protein
VSKVAKTLDRILRGNADANIRFDDRRALLTHMGFAERIRGGHHIFSRDGVAEILNLQPRGAKAKEVRALVTSYALAGPPEAQDATDEKPTPPAAEENHGG